MGLFIHLKQGVRPAKIKNDCCFFAQKRKGCVTKIEFKECEGYGCDSFESLLHNLSLFITFVFIGVHLLSFLHKTCCLGLLVD